MKTLHRVLYCLLLLGLVACQSGGGVSFIPQNRGPYEGPWRVAGLGAVVNVEGEDIHYYMVTSVSCTPIVNEPIKLKEDKILVDDNEVGEVKRDGENMVLHLIGGGADQVFTRMDKLPDVCNEPVDETKAKSAAYSYEVFWNSFNELYPYFELREIDWKAKYDQYKTTVSDQTTDIGIAIKLVSMVEDFEDCNVSIVRQYVPDVPYEFPELWRSFSGEIPRMAQKTYLQEVKKASTGRMIYGRLNNTTGYISYNNIGLIPQYVNGSGEADDKAFIQEMDDAFKYMSSVKTLVLDLRSLQYQTDLRLGLLLAGRFAQERTLAFTTQVIDPLSPKGPKTLTEPEEVYVEPEAGSPVFHGKVIVLTSPMISSTSEQVLLALKALPNVTTVGTTTAGCLSQPLYLPMPNGMSFTLSYEVITAADGNEYEKDGIPPVKFIDMNKDDFYAGRDPILEEAIALAQE